MWVIDWFNLTFKRVHLARIGWVHAMMLALVCFALATSAQAADPGPPKFVTIPLLYLTDRDSEGRGYGNHRRYPSNCLHRMYYGTCYVTMDNKAKEFPSKISDTLGWAFTDERPRENFRMDQIDPERPVISKRLFFERIAQTLDKAGTDRLAIFVHGALEGFDDAAEDAAEIAYNLKRPLVMYSWPSEPKLLDFAVDNGNCEWSQGHFNLFGRDLAAFKQRHPLKVILIAHSMGNRLIVRGLQHFNHMQLVCDCELISPDIDFDTCRHYLFGFKRVDDQGPIRLYVSNKDKMLKFSQKLFGGYARLGEDVKTAQIGGRPMEQFTVKKDTDKHEARTEIAEGDDATDAAPIDEIIERIDFTAVDKGFVGHSIPFQLVAAMVDGSAPGKGLELENVTSEEDSRPLKVVRTKP